jgi:glyoxylase-like metal-dependent hydrolase (beta-lactamase superfamily II)
MTGELGVAHPWFAAEDAGGGVTRLYEPHIDPLLESNVWHVPGRDADLIVDFANGIGPLRPVVDALALEKPMIAVATHGHFDHVGGLHEFDDRRVHPADADMTRSPFPLKLRRDDFAEGTEEMYAYYGYEVPDILISAVPAPDFDVAGWVSPGAEPTTLVDEGDVLDVGDRRFTVLHTPGHTAGSVCLLEEKTGMLFTGDALYVDGRLSWDDPGTAARSLSRIRDLEVLRAHAGHARSFDGAELRVRATEAIEEIEEIERNQATP